MVIIFWIIVFAIWVISDEYKLKKYIYDKKKRAAENNDPDAAEVAIDHFWFCESNNSRIFELPLGQYDALRKEYMKIKGNASQWRRTGIKPECLNGIDFNAMREGNYIIQGYNDPDSMRKRLEHFKKLDEEKKIRQEEHERIMKGK